MGLHGNFAWLVCITWALALASSSLALVISCGVASAQKAIQLAPLALIPQMLFSGLFLPVGKIPGSLQWVKYLCPLKYAINLATLTEFHYVHQHIRDCEGAGTPPLAKKHQCQMENPGYYLRQGLVNNQGVEWNDWSADPGILVALMVGFRILSTILLWRKGKYVF